MESIKVKVSHEKEITRCWHQCPYFSLEINVMVCDHPDAESPYIISHPECREGFPEKCPLIK